MAKGTLDIIKETEKSPDVLLDHEILLTEIKNVEQPKQKSRTKRKSKSIKNVQKLLKDIEEAFPFCKQIDVHIVNFENNTILRNKKTKIKDITIGSPLIYSVQYYLSQYGKELPLDHPLVILGFALASNTIDILNCISKG